jgi:hypothetical protein
MVYKRPPTLQAGEMISYLIVTSVHLQYQNNGRRVSTTEEGHEP